MAFKTKKERYAYVKGIKKGMRGGKPYGKKKKTHKPTKKPLKKKKLHSLTRNDKWFTWDDQGKLVWLVDFD